ncbi:MAG: hypothetical protein Q7W30_10445 [Coriobacteriia bacterium]|nr:hypothetical protein [Coriobacteriia bacterium]
MEFSIWCPSDGSVEVGLEDIDSIVVRSGSDVEVMFICPRCGARVTMSAQVPHALLATLDEAWVQIDGAEPHLITLRRDASSVPQVMRTADTDERIESYCEYFRRELDGVCSLDDMLTEIDAHEVR